MSSGWNGTPIRGVGRIREKLADMLNDMLKLEGRDRIHPEDLKRTNPNHRHWEDCCAWDCYTNEKVRRHVYSWSTMTNCVKGGIKPDNINSNDIEV